MAMAMMSSVTRMHRCLCIVAYLTCMHMYSDESRTTLAGTLHGLREQCVREGEPCYTAYGDFVAPKSYVVVVWRCDGVSLLSGVVCEITSACSQCRVDSVSMSCVPSNDCIEMRE